MHQEGEAEMPYVPRKYRMVNINSSSGVLNKQGARAQDQYIRAGLQMSTMSNTFRM